MDCANSFACLIYLLLCLGNCGGLKFENRLLFLTLTSQQIQIEILVQKPGQKREEFRLTSGYVVFEPRAKFVQLICAKPKLTL